MATLAAFAGVPAIGLAHEDGLSKAFRDPPAVAAPRVWWHWMNGNITEEGIRLDLQWMRDVGIGGAQVFEGDLDTPQVVPHPLPYMSPGWGRAFRTASDTATALGLELTIASSPGWSSAGGPWVLPPDAMKKMVWSETLIPGGKRFVGRLARPPDVAGPFQQVPKSAVQANAPVELPRLYRDSAVVAFPDTGAPANRPVARSASGAEDATVLTDGDYQSGVSVPAEAPWLEYHFDNPQRVSAAVVGLPTLQGFGSAPSPVVRLECSDDGLHWRVLVTLTATTSPVRSASFSPIYARWFRLVLASDLESSPAAGDLAPAAGAVMFPPPASPGSYRVTEWALFADARVNAFAEKAGFAPAPDYYALDTPAAAAEHPVGLKDVLDLTSRLRADGTLDWTAPPGKPWRVLRLGYSLTGQRNGPAPRDATGLEVDKLRGAAVDRYMDTYLSKYDEILGSSPSALGSLLTDSIESGPQNWTDDLIDAFRRLRGYDPVRWLPVLTGVVIGSAAQSDSFLWDFRRTLSDLLASEYYGRAAAKAHERGWQYYAEALEDHRPQLGDDMQMRSAADIPMGAMWMFASGAEPKPTFVADLQGAASVAHLFGKPLVAAESLTVFGRPWGFSPRDLKHVADLEFSLGVNRIAIHESAHQPFTDRTPGMALSPLLGQYFNRNETWAPMAHEWVRYLSRSSFLLQQGTPRADVAYFYGEEAPLTGLFGTRPMSDVPDGYPFDFVSAAALMGCLSADADGLIACGGSRYRILYLGGSSARMSLPTVRKLWQLASAGAVIVGSRPTGSPSLADDMAAYRAVVDALFGPRDNTGQPRAIGRGKVIETDLESALRMLKLGPDWHWSSANRRVKILHRALADGELYYLSNQSGKGAAGEIDVAVTGKRAELWHADTGAIEATSYRIAAGRTHVPIELKADESVFIVMRQLTDSTAEQIPASPLRVLRELTAPWQLDFPQQPKIRPLSLPSLVSWTALPSDEIRHYSGIGRYRASLDLPSGWIPSDDAIYIDLGTVDELAAVAINGRAAGVAWHTPYRLDITSLLKPGRNEISVEVANLWVNRLIGDARATAVAETFTTGPTYTADAPLKSSGLLGPVRLLGRTQGPRQVD